MPARQELAQEGSLGSLPSGPGNTHKGSKGSKTKGSLTQKHGTNGRDATVTSSIGNQSTELLPDTKEVLKKN